ncbi:hypothetical protein OG216_46000 (plasmid) [Streptomycetaceae bacterium NBC_01309]
MQETALDFGYWVSSDVALRTTGVSEQVKRTPKWRMPTARQFRLALFLTVAAATPCAALLPSPWRLLVIVCGVMTAGALAILLPGRPTAYSVLSACSWETWPATVVAVGAPDTRGNATVVFGLLRPDGTPHGTVQLEVRWPTQALATLRPGGRLAVWFAGDLRFGGVVALPGGAHPEVAVVHGYSRLRGTDAENAVAWRAGFLVQHRHRPYSP